jgi:hypothetical protein
MNLSTVLNPSERIHLPAASQGVVSLAA